MLIDEAWLQGLASQTPKPLPRAADASVEQIGDQPAWEPRVDWGDALAVPSFYGREQERAQLSRWVVEERCRVVSMLGLGGIGKSALTVTLMHQVAAHFEVVIWRSLRDTRGNRGAPPGAAGSANLLALLRTLRGHLRGLDLSHLSIRGAYLRGVEMQDTTLSGALLRETVFTEAFAAPWVVAMSPNGFFMAAGNRRGEVQVWREKGKILDQVWQAHTSVIQALGVH